MHGFWFALGMLLLLYFFISVCKYFVLYCVVLNSNKKLHEDMIYKLARSPCSYFDITTTGQLGNKFSGDMGVIDGALAGELVDSIEAPIMIFILLGNVVVINKMFLVPAIVNFFILVCFFMYSKDTIIAAKNLDLESKSPVFTMVREMILGLLQIKIFKRRAELLQQFAYKINQSLKCTLTYNCLFRALSIILSYFCILMLWIGIIIGIMVVTPETAALYSVSIVFIMTTNDQLLMFFTQFLQI